MTPTMRSRDSSYRGMRLKPDFETRRMTSRKVASVGTAVTSVRGVMSSRTVWSDISRTPRIMRRSSMRVASSSAASSVPTSSSAGSIASDVPARPSARMGRTTGAVSRKETGRRTNCRIRAGASRRPAEPSGRLRVMMRAALRSEEISRMAMAPAIATRCHWTPSTMTTRAPVRVTVDRVMPARR